MVSWQYTPQSHQSFGVRQVLHKFCDVPKSTMTEPNETTIQALDKQINASLDVSVEDKKSKRKLLRMMFHMGNLLREQGVSEEFLKKKMPHEAATIMTGGWSAVESRMPRVLAMWKRQQ
jgi:hypothetical protein